MLDESEAWILADLCLLCIVLVSSPAPSSEISKHLIQQILASFWDNLIPALPSLCVLRWSCSWNNWKWWIPILSDSTATADTAEWIPCVRKPVIHSYGLLRKQQCWDYKDNNLSTSLKNRKLYGWQEMHKNMKDEKL